jgi:hypothetical protein
MAINTSDAISSVQTAAKTAALSNSLQKYHDIAADQQKPFPQTEGLLIFCF